MSDLENNAQEKGTKKRPYNLREKKEKDAAYRSLIRPELAAITVTPSRTGGNVDGGSWQMTPAGAQTITTSGHTPDDNFHLCLLYTSRCV